MHPHAQLIETFYQGFARRDGEAMAACYHPQVEFTDEVFVGLKGAEASGMWRMLTQRAKDFSLEYSGVSADDQSGRAHWDARYTFAATGRKVLNRIDAEFKFQDGKIIWHRDTFDFWVWSRQALGLPGVLLGWSGFLRHKVQAQARAGLTAFLQKAK